MGSILITRWITQELWSSTCSSDSIVGRIVAMIYMIVLICNNLKFNKIILKILTSSYGSNITWILIKTSLIYIYNMILHGSV